MKLEADARIAFPREVVYRAYRDSLPEMIPYLPNVKQITVKEREDSLGGVEGKTRLLNLWEGKADDIPKLAQGVIKPDMIGWLDYATWNQNNWSCDWRIETRVFTENVRCSGHNEYIEDGENTILKIRGELEINLKGIPGVPRLLAGKVTPHVEKFIVNLLTPNLVSVADGLEAYLKAQA